MPRPLARTALAPALLALVAACASSSPAADHAAAPAPAAPPPPARWPAGTFDVRTKLDVATSGLAGARLSASLLLLTELDAHPGRALLSLAAIQGLPAVAKLRKVPRLGAKLEAYLDDAVAREAPAGADRFAALAEDLRALTRVIELGSTLAVTTPAAGDATATHALRALTFTIADQRLEVPVPAALVDAVRPTTPALAADGAALTLGAHAFAVPYGAMLLTAAGPLVFQPLGGPTLREALAAQVGCPRVAARLGANCELGACVRDAVPEATLAAVCDQAVAALAAQVEAQVAAQRFDVLALEAGRATLADAALRGTWTVRVEAEGEVATGTAPFTAARVATP
ncbi:MAG: hypothetical protein IPH44_10005 [Myxococcales bacterium]|nr:hypothetical protein [Myxococcales bacterium]MBK7198880.1 hypothetical protein [Myxococcales bacterium]MBP6846428.1 hypothetical protein [Kofleriaceae bacterium]